MDANQRCTFQSNASGSGAGLYFASQMQQQAVANLQVHGCSSPLPIKSLASTGTQVPMTCSMVPPVPPVPDPPPQPEGTRSWVRMLLSLACRRHAGTVLAMPARNIIVSKGTIGHPHSCRGLGCKFASKERGCREGIRAIGKPSLPTSRTCVLSRTSLCRCRLLTLPPLHLETQGLMRVSCKRSDYAR